MHPENHPENPTFYFRDLETLLNLIHVLPSDWKSMVRNDDENIIKEFKIWCLFTLEVNRTALMNAYSKIPSSIKKKWAEYNLSAGVRHLSVTEIIHYCNLERKTLLNQILESTYEVEEEIVENIENTENTQSNESNEKKPDEEVLNASEKYLPVVVYSGHRVTTDETESSEEEGISIDLSELSVAYKFFLFLVMCFGVIICIIGSDFRNIIRGADEKNISVENDIILEVENLKADQPKQCNVNQTFYGMFNSQDLLNPKNTSFSIPEKVRILENTEFLGPSFYNTIPTDPLACMVVYNIEWSM
jgi:hypothetical protein